MRVLADPNRVRLLALLEREELTVAELANITQLAQPRVSTHLAKLRESSLVRDRRSGVQSYYRLNDALPEDGFNAIWTTVRNGLDDALLKTDADRLPAVLSARARSRNWADAVAGDMERHYSPGRTWEATARAAFEMVQLGRVLDIASGDGVMAELLAPNAEHVTCVDVSEKVIEAAKRRLKKYANVDFQVADMHALPSDEGHFDTVLLTHALTYTKKPDAVLKECARVLIPGGQVVATTLHEHSHEQAVEPFGHVNLGFTPKQLRKFATEAGLEVQRCEVTSKENRAPHFEVITLNAYKQK